MLSPLLNDRLVSCGLDMIGISVQGVNAQAFMDISSARVDYENYRENVKDLFQRSRGKVKISVKIADVGLTPDDRVKFLEDFDDRCDFIAIEGLHGWSASHMGDWRMGTEQSFDGTPRTEKVACPLVLYMLTISANGDISICNDDWAHVHQIGNVSRDSLPEVWTGEKLRAFRMMHLFGLRAENKACGTCDYLAALPDSIDADRGRLINALR
jgi:radical SAM protein with 4Fe4S-binding SPASM domain